LPFLLEVLFTVRQTAATYRDYEQFVVGNQPVATDTVAINGLTYTFRAAGDVTSGSTSTITIGAAITNTLASLETAIEARDPMFAIDAATVRVRTNSNSGVTGNTLVLEALATPYTVNWNFTTANQIPIHPAGGTNPYADNTAFTIDKTNAMIFNSDGIPSAFNITELEILNFENGAFSMDDDASHAKQMTIDFGTVTESNGMTQFGDAFSPVFITQDGSQFGTFSGVTIAADGLVTALFDNGETRPVYKIPIATFVDVNTMGLRSGNVWNATQASGDPTLREADNGPAGQVVQATLEQSTVDIGEEFTKMIVVQRAFSAAAKIISTADQMLEELLRTKR